MEKHINIPNIPKSVVKSVVIDYRVDDEVLKTLSELGIDTIKTERCNELYESINGHPDILMHHLGGNKIVVAPNIYDSFSCKLIKKGFAVIKGDAWLQRNYPENIAYNILRIGKFAFHNLKYTDKKIRMLYDSLDIKLININQGYSKCSVCVLSEDAAITSDKKIAQALEKCNIEVLLIEPGGIKLTGLNYGFIGGASGLLSKSEIAFTGYIHELKDHRRIIDFLESKGFFIRILSCKKIIDIGSIIALTY